MGIFVAFITGLTTGGLSCLAVQGGLLASSLAHQLEHDLGKKDRTRGIKMHIAQPILWFLLAKLSIYTLAGFLLGALGAVFQLSSIARAALQIFIGIFMVGSALRMLNVHPIFRYFTFEPPSFITRYIRKTARKESAALTPVFLGLLTILIPCGVTQVVMASAIASSDPLQGAALLFAFTLGASPVFFFVAYFATRLGATVERYFMKGVAVLILLIGLLTINTGLNLAGSPLAVNFAKAAQPANASTLPDPTESPAQVETQILEISVRNNGYTPQVIHAQADVPYQLKLVSKNVRSCSLAFVIPALDVEKLLPSTGVELIDIPAQKPGYVLRYSCSMGMYTGKIVFDQ